MVINRSSRGTQDKLKSFTKIKENTGDEILASHDEKSCFSKVIQAINGYMHNYEFGKKTIKTIWVIVRENSIWHAVNIEKG